MKEEWFYRKEECGPLLDANLDLPMLLPPIIPQEEVFRKPLPESPIPIHIPLIEMIRNNPELFPGVLCYHRISQKDHGQVNPLPSPVKPNKVIRYSQRQITAIQVPDPSLTKVSLISRKE